MVKRNLSVLGTLAILATGIGGLMGCVNLDDYSFHCESHDDCLEGYWCQTSEVAGDPHLRCIAEMPPIALNFSPDNQTPDNQTPDNQTPEGCSSPGPFGQGTGVSGDPFLLCTFDHLKALSESPQYWNHHFAMADDIEASTMEPIGNDETFFNGHFDGRGHTIHGAEISGFHDVGLFGVLGHASRVEHLILNEITVTGLVRVGSLAGRALSGSEVHDVTAHVVLVDGGDLVGGLIGRADGSGTMLSVTSGVVEGQGTTGGIIGRLQGSLNLASASVTVIRTESLHTDLVGIGGLVGHLASGTILNSEALGNVTDLEAGNGTVGGLVGISNTSVYRSRALGQVRGNQAVGGLVGTLNGGDLYDSYFTGSVEGTTIVGGLVGDFIRHSGTRTIQHCYNFGEASGFFEHVGPIFGRRNHGSATVVDSFWNTTNNFDLSFGDFEGALSEAEFDDQDNFPWDFTDVWTLHDSDRPRLQWEFDE